MLIHRHNTYYDVIIIGNAISGSILASILARNALKVLIIDNKSHPKFAIGESTVPYATQMLSMMGNKYQVPELKYFNPDFIEKKIGRSSGLKKIFGFIYHDKTDGYSLDKSLLFGNTWRTESHLFRQDVDPYFLRTSLKYGASALHDKTITDICIDEKTGVEVELADGEKIRSCFIVDASGYNSVLAQLLNLREDPCRFKVQSRSIFTHMIDVVPFEEVTHEKLSMSWADGTLHHIFDGGWMWIIPFNNHEGSINPVASVGLVLDSERYPQDVNLSPEQEFEQFINQHPTIAKQFKNAKPVRAWISTPRIQYSSSKSVGNRFCLMSSASGFIDPLYSRGLVGTFIMIDKLAEKLIQCHETNDYAFEHFKSLEKTHRQLLDYTDKLVHGSYLSWRDFDVWNAWFRVWAIEIGTIESNFGSYVQLGKYSKFKKTTNPIYSEFEDAGYRDFFNASYAIIKEFGEEYIDAEIASKRLFETIEKYNFDMVQRDGDNNVRWALKNPLCRNLLIGKDNLQANWKAGQIDSHLKKEGVNCGI